MPQLTFTSISGGIAVVSGENKQLHCIIHTPLCAHEMQQPERDMNEYERVTVDMQQRGSLPIN